MKKHKRRRLILVLLVILMIIIFVFIYNKTKVLPIYIPEETASTTKVEISCETVHPLSDSLEIIIPKGCRNIKDNNLVYFLSDNINITVEKVIYNYTIGLITADMYSQSLSTDVNLITYNFPTTSSRMVVYEKEKTTIFIYTTWDREYIYNITYEIKTNMYDKYIDYIKRSIDEIKWSKNKPISEQLVMGYSEFGNCQFAIPYGWENINNNTSIMYKNDTDTMIMTVEIYENSNFLENISNLTYVQAISENKQNFSQRLYNCSKNKIYAENTYIDNQKQVNMCQAIFANGKYQYFITFYIYDDSFNDEVYQMIQEALTYFTV